MLRNVQKPLLRFRSNLAGRLLSTTAPVGENESTTVLTFTNTNTPTDPLPGDYWFYNKILCSSSDVGECYTQCSFFSGCNIGNVQDPVWNQKDSKQTFILKIHCTCFTSWLCSCSIVTFLSSCPRYAIVKSTWRRISLNLLVRSKKGTEVHSFYSSSSL